MLYITYRPQILPTHHSVSRAYTSYSWSKRAARAPAITFKFLAEDEGRNKEEWRKSKNGNWKVTVHLPQHCRGAVHLIISVLELEHACF